MSVNTTNAREKAIAFAIQELGGGSLSPATQRLLLDTFRRSDKILNDDGSVKTQANLSGRTEPLGTTVQNVDATGNLQSLANVNTRTTDLLTDGTGSPLTGGKRGFVALDSNNRLAGTFRNNPVNVNLSPTSSTVLSNDGVSHTINVAAETVQYGDGQVSYNSGSIDPGAFGTFFIYADDPGFEGGAVAYQFATTPQDQVAANGRILFGAITTASGSSNTGGGTTGGTTPGGGGGRGINQG